MLLKRWALFVTLIACMSCGDDSTSPEEEDFLPIFTNSWTNTDDRNHTFNLISADDAQASGVITGSEFINGVESGVIEGRFEGLRVTNLTVDPPAGANRVYTGRLVLPNVLLLTNATETLVLYRPQ